VDSFNSSYDDEFEEVPSPFQKTAVRNKPSQRNIFSRPLGTTPSEAPTVVEEPTRRSPGRPEQTDFLTARRHKSSVPQVDYLDDEEVEDEEEEVEERRVVVRSKPKVKAKAKVDYLPRIGWAIVAMAMLRLIFMDRGVIDYVSMDGKLTDRGQELTRVENENKEIGSEIQRISLDKTYQRQLTKEHLGVIAADEFLILFAGESQESESEADRPL
jgi:cell division protein FtsB